jgi:hypothetical protein
MLIDKSRNQLEDIITTLFNIIGDIIVGNKIDGPVDKFANNGIAIETTMETKEFSSYHLLNNGYVKHSIHVHVIYSKKLKNILKNVLPNDVTAWQSVDIKAIKEDTIVVDMGFSPRIDGEKHTFRFRGILAGEIETSKEEVSVEFTILFKNESEYHNAVSLFQECFRDDQLFVRGNTSLEVRKRCKCGAVLMENVSKISIIGGIVASPGFHKMVCPQCIHNFIVSEDRINELWRNVDRNGIQRLKTAIYKQYELAKE